MSRSRSRRSIISLILSFVTLFISVESAGQCHAPDGSINADPAYQPCATDTSDPLHTICCATNRTQGADICVPNGLCQTGIKPGDPPKDPHYTKPQCTNANWDEPGCLHVCGVSSCISIQDVGFGRWLNYPQEGEGICILRKCILQMRA